MSKDAAKAEAQAAPQAAPQAAEEAHPGPILVDATLPDKGTESDSAEEGDDEDAEVRDLKCEMEEMLREFDDSADDAPEQVGHHVQWGCHANYNCMRCVAGPVLRVDCREPQATLCCSC